MTNRICHPFYSLSLLQEKSNYVLLRDGDGDYVRLPPDMFDDLDEAMLEGWVK
jgi:hypothetical protein